MTDWRIESGVTRLPEDNDVIGVPINAEHRLLTQKEADLQAILTMEMRESVPYRFAEQVGEFSIIALRAKLRKI
jgi:hypothetical protein